MKAPEGLHAFVWQDPAVNNANTYLLRGSKRILIDPGHYHLFGNVRDRLSNLSLRPQDIDLILLTHGHPDHVEAIRAFSNSHTVVAMHETESAFVGRVARYHGSVSGNTNFEPQILLREGELLVGDREFQVILTPGHSPGSICLYWLQEKALFTGDVIFSQGIGRTDLPGGDGEAP